MSIDKITVEIISFGYRYNQMPEANLVFDTRFLKNPHWDPKMKFKTGLDKDVFDYVFSIDGANETYEAYLNAIKVSLPLFQKKAELKQEINKKIIIAFGCTGGQHRSVAYAQRLANDLTKDGYKVVVNHRDLQKTLELNNG
ncbi:MAG: hypothetical protein LBC17_00660 [Lactobacillaceae bacterium]|jgi:UPF0042 nucleotide-binding protein|nr:hypothetical protein [Lactobacillaceae bacterium]